MKGARNMKKSLIALLAMLLALLGADYDAATIAEADHQQSEPAKLELVAPAQLSEEISAHEPFLGAPETDYRAGLDRFDLSAVNEYQTSPYCEVNENRPFFDESEYLAECFEYYAPLDELGRCGVTMAHIGKELMPTEERGSIGMIKPTGWHTVRYDDLIEDHYLYNRCHLLGYQLTGENANVRNLITGTRYMNTEGMEPFESMVGSYVRRTGGRVLMRVTPIFGGDDLLARGVLMEAISTGDGGASICFCVFVYNVQPGIVIDYATGESRRLDAEQLEQEPITGYIGNKKSLVFHLPTCPNLPAEKNQVHFDTREEALAAGYHACGNCHP